MSELQTTTERGRMLLRIEQAANSAGYDLLLKEAQVSGQDDIDIRLVKQDPPALSVHVSDRVGAKLKVGG